MKPDCYLLLRWRHQCYDGGSSRYQCWTKPSKSIIGLFTLDAPTSLRQTKGSVEMVMQLLSVSSPYCVGTQSSHWDTATRKYRCTPCMPKCKKYEKETLKWPPSSNFILHSQICKSIPEAQK
jgi:hypothetical protein